MVKSKHIRYIVISLLLVAALSIGLVSVFTASAVKVVIPHRYADEASLLKTADALKADGQKDSFLVVRYVDADNMAAMHVSDELITEGYARVDFGVLRAGNIMGIDMRLKYDASQVTLQYSEDGSSLITPTDVTDEQAYALFPYAYGDLSEDENYLYFFDDWDKDRANDGAPMFDDPDDIQILVDENDQPSGGFGFLLTLPLLSGEENSGYGVAEDVCAAVPDLVKEDTESGNWYFNTTAVTDQVVYYASTYFQITNKVDPDTFGLYIGRGMEGAWAGVGDENAAAHTAFVGFPRPEMTVVSTIVNDGDLNHLEVGLNIGSGSETSFSSAGVILRYDPTMMVPTTWKPDPEDGLYKPLAVKEAESWETAWADCMLLGTKSADEINGRVAAAFTIKDDPSGSAYLYLSASVAKTMVGMMQSLPTGTDLPSETLVNDNYKTETVEAHKPIRYMSAAETGTQQAVVARFNILGEGGSQYAMKELAENLDVLTVEDDVKLKDFPLNVRAGDAVSFITDNTEFDGTEDIITTAKTNFLWIAQGVTADSGSAKAIPDPSDFASIVFYDWDETILGSIIVPKGESTYDADGVATAGPAYYVKEFTDARIASKDEIEKVWPGDDTAVGDPDDGAKYQWYSRDKIALDLATQTDNDSDNDRIPRYLSSHKGYDFDTWLLESSSTFPAQDNALPAYTGENEDVDAAKAAGVADFRKVTGDMIVVASYKANSTLNAGGSNNYSIGEPTYMRTGTGSTASYVMTIEIKRQNTAGYGVSRLKDPILRIRSIPAAASDAYVFTYGDMGQKDVTSVEIAASAGIGSMDYYVTVYQKGWAGGADRSAIGKQYRDAGVAAADDYGFMQMCTINYINEMGHAGKAGDLSYTDFDAFQQGLVTNATWKKNVKKYFTNWYSAHPNEDLTPVTVIQVAKGTLK